YDRRDNKIIVHAQDNDTSQYIKDCHERHQLFTYACDRFNTAKDNDRGQNCDYNSNCCRRNIKVLIGNCCDRVYLSCTSDTEGCKTCQDRKQHTEPFHVQSSFQCIEGTALHTAVFCFYSVFYSDQ